MAIVVVGGQTKNVGKTGVVEGLIRAFSDMQWTAIKIEPGASGKADVEIIEESERASGTDTSRYLAAGAVRALWVKTSTADIAPAIPRIREVLEQAKNVVIESNRIRRFLTPDVYLSVFNPGVQDFKKSAMEYLNRADALLVPEEKLGQWRQYATTLRLPKSMPVLPIWPPVYMTEEVVKFLYKQLCSDKT